MELKFLYKYHINLYCLYEAFGDQPFNAGAGVNAIAYSIYRDKKSTLYFSGLQKKKYLKTLGKANAQVRVGYDWNFRCTYRILTPLGLEVARYIENNKKLLTQYLLKK